MSQKIINKTGHIFSEDITTDVFYTYDKKHNKIYDVQSLRRKFKLIIDNLKKRK